MVVAHLELDDPAADVGRHVHKVGLQIGVVGARPLVDPARCKHPGHEHAGQREDAHQDAERLANRQHRLVTEPKQRLVTEPKQPGEQRGGHRKAGIGEQRGDDVFADAGHREDLPHDDGMRSAPARHNRSADMRLDHLTPAQARAFMIADQTAGSGS